MNDFIFNQTRSRQPEEPKVLFEIAKKQQDIDSFTNPDQLPRTRGKKANLTKKSTPAEGAFLLFVIGFIFNRYLLKQRRDYRFERHQKELDQKNILLETLNAEQEKWLKEKEWLIRELQHRVKNNLQMVTSLLRTQSVHLTDEVAIQAVKDGLRRMQAMSLIHQKLYQGETISTIAMPDYVNDLVRYLEESFVTGNRIVFEQTIEPVELDVTQAIPLGLIINESIVNAIKYAFLNGQKGIVCIQLQRDGPEHLLFKLSGNGLGLPEELNIMEYNSLGLELMEGLARQLNGTFTLENKNGVYILIRFFMLIT